MRYAVTAILAMAVMSVAAQTQGEPLYRYDEALAKKICEQVAAKYVDDGLIVKTEQLEYQEALKKVFAAYFKDKGNRFGEPVPMTDVAKKRAKVNIDELSKQASENSVAIETAKEKLAKLESHGDTFTEPDSLTKLRTYLQQDSAAMKLAQTAADGKRAERDSIQALNEGLDQQIADLKTQIESAQKRYDNAQEQLKAYGLDGVIELPTKVSLAKAEQAKNITTANAGVVAEALGSYNKYGQTYLQLHPDDKQMANDVESLKKFHALIAPIEQAKQLMAGLEFDSDKDAQVLTLLKGNKYTRTQEQQVKPLIDALGDHEIYYFNMRRILNKLNAALTDNINDKDALLKIIDSSVDLANPGHTNYTGYYEGYNNMLAELRDMIADGKLSKNEIERIANELKITVQ